MRRGVWIAAVVFLASALAPGAPALDNSRYQLELDWLNGKPVARASAAESVTRIAEYLLVDEVGEERPIPVGGILPRGSGRRARSPR